MVSSYLTPVPEIDIPVELPNGSGVVHNAGFESDVEANTQNGVTRRQSSSDQRNSVSAVPNLNLLQSESASLKSLSVIVIDCSTINFVDVVGAGTLQGLAKECKRKEIKLAFANCSGNFSFRSCSRCMSLSLCKVSF